MKAKKLLVFLLALVIVLALTVAACEPEVVTPPEKTDAAVEVTSNKTPTIEVGQTYTLAYNSSDTVKVTVSPTEGCSYNETSQKFSATKAGTYTLTITASGENKNDKVVTVTITVTASAANKEALQAALAGLEGLVQGDYTSQSWTALDRTKDQAEETLETAGVTQEDVDEAKANLEAKKDALVPVAIDKAVVNENSLTYNGTTYLDEDYSNLAAINERVTALNNNTQVVLKSVYAVEIAKIIADLDKKLELNFVDIYSGVMLVSGFNTYQFGVTSEEGATIVVKIGDDELEVDKDGKYTVQPDAFDTNYTITATATKGEQNNTKSVTVSFAKMRYTSNKGNDITVENDVITVNTEGLGWGDNKGKKVMLDDVAFAGDFSVTFDVVFTHHRGDAGNANVMALFFWTEEGSAIAGKDERFVALCQQNSWLEVTTDGSIAEMKSRKPINAGDAALTLNETYRIRVTRTIENGASKLKAELISDTNKVLFTNEGIGTIPYAGAVKLGIQAENAKFTVSNFSVNTVECIITKAALNSEIDKVNKLDLIESDYTAETWATFNTALTKANSISNTSGNAQSAIDAATTALKTATNGLIAKAVVKHENVYDADAKTITWNGITYNEAITSNVVEIIAKLVAIDANSDLKQSEYDAQYLAAIEEIDLTLKAYAIGLPQGKVVLSELKSYEFTAESNAEEATVTVTINGEAVEADEDKYTLTPTAFGIEYKVVVTASLGEGASIFASYSSIFVEANYTKNVDDVNITADSLSIGPGYGWGGTYEGRKAVLDSILLVGDFSVTFDLTFTATRDGANVMALFMLRADGSMIPQWVAVCQHSNLLEVANGGDGAEKPQFAMPEGTTALNNTIRVKVTRTYVDGKSFIQAELLDMDTNEPLTLTKGDNEYTANMGYRGGNQPNGEHLSRGDSTKAVILGFQAENVAYTVKNIVINGEAVTLDAKELRDTIGNKGINALVESDYTVESWATLKNTLKQANAVNDNIWNADKVGDVTQSIIDNATKALKDAIDGLVKVAVTEPEVTMTGEEPNQTIEKITFNGVEYIAAIYKNFDAIKTEIDEIETDGVLNSVYKAQVLEVLAKLESNYTVTIACDDYILINKTFVGQELTLKAVVAEADAELTFVWKVGGVVIEDANAATLKWTATTFDNYVITVQAKDADGKLSNVATYEVAILEAEPYIPEKFVNAGAKFEDNTFKFDVRAEWGDWEGRKMAFEDLIFNGSFEFTIEYEVLQADGPNVVTIHMMNADTLTLRDSRDNARVGYMAINADNNKIEVNDGNRKTDLGNIQDYTRTVGSKVRLTLRAEKQLDNTYILTGMLDVDIPNGDGEPTHEHREYRNDSKTGSMGAGMIIGVNIEHMRVNVSNFGYKLLNGENIISGSVGNKRALHNAIAECVTVDLSKYEDTTEFLKALNNAKVAYRNNGIGAEYDAYATALLDAKEALAEKDVNVTVGGLDQGYTNFTNGDFEAVVSGLEEGTQATIEWSFDYLGEASNPVLNAEVEEPETQSDDEAVAKHFTFVGANIKLAAGKYTGVTLKITVGDDVYTYTYQDFTVQDVVLKSNVNQVVVDNEAGKATVTDGNGWGHKEQLMLEGISAQNFEISFQVKQTSEHGGDYRLVCLNLFGEDCRLVLGYQRQGRGGRLHIGDDDMGEGTFVEIFKEGDNARAEDYEAIYNETVTFKVTCWVDADFVAHITWTIIDADGKVIYTLNRTKVILHNDSRTTPRFTFENVNVELSNFDVKYTQFVWDIEE